MLGILYEKKFVPIAIGVFSHETMDVFKMVFEWIDANTDTAPTNLMEVRSGDRGYKELMTILREFFRYFSHFSSEIG